jgi:hypothetical protein
VTKTGAEVERTNRPFFLTDMPVWLMLTLLALGLPRTILADLGIVEPEGSLFYYFLALTPFAAWLVVAVVRETRKPIADFLMLGTLYGLSLVVVHQILWDLGPSLGHQPPAGAVSFAESVSPNLYELALRGYTIVIAMIIGVGAGLVTALIALAAKAVRSARRRSHSTETS